MTNIKTDIPSNPAGRLHRLVYLAQRTGNSDKKTVADAWAEVLRIHPSDTARLYSAICQIALLPQRVREEIGRLPNIDAARFTTWVEAATIALTVKNFDITANQVLAPFSSDRMSLILICDDMLRVSATTQALDADKIEELRKQAASLRRTVMLAELDDVYREHILKHVTIIEAALWDVAIHGQHAAKSAVEHTLGVAVAEAGVFRAVARTDAGRGLLALLAAFVVAMDAGVHLKNLLEAGADGIAEISNALAPKPQATPLLLPQGDSPRACEPESD